MASLKTLKYGKEYALGYKKHATTHGKIIKGIFICTGPYTQTGETVSTTVYGSLTGVFAVKRNEASIAGFYVGWGNHSDLIIPLAVPQSRILGPWEVAGKIQDEANEYMKRRKEVEKKRAQLYSAIKAAIIAVTGANNDTIKITPSSTYVSYLTISQLLALKEKPGAAAALKKTQALQNQFNEFMCGEFLTTMNEGVKYGYQKVHF